MIDPPPIVFSEWVRWGDRARLKAADGQPSPGVYLWARFAHPPKSGSHPYPDLPEELLYAGETKNLNVRPLGGRTSGGTPHHRLAHYGDCFPDDAARALLYVSVFHVIPFKQGDKQCLRAFTRYVEDLIYWEYAKRYGKRARLDYKKGKDRD